MRFFPGQANHRHRYIAQTDHIAGRAADDTFLYFSVAVGSHDDQVEVAFLRGRYNLLDRVADFDHDVLLVQRARGNFFGYTS